MNIIIWPVIIFFSILFQVLFGTVRLIVMVKNKKFLTVLIGFFESAIALSIAITVISKAVREGINIFVILSYSAGFALGLYIGMLISQLISRDVLSVTVISRLHSIEIEEFLREKGFGITRYSGDGKDGSLKILNIICNKRNLNELKLYAKQIDPKVLFSYHSLEGMSGGFIYNIRNKI
ncbi:MAG: hypothetical protein JW770_06330 [Actinobacteria bacterium]|nr:hypothetical protein [Actinomycetota bacterium]